MANTCFTCSNRRRRRQYICISQHSLAIHFFIFFKGQMSNFHMQSHCVFQQLTKKRIAHKNLSQVHSRIQALPTIVDQIRLQNRCSSSKYINLHLYRQNGKNQYIRFYHMYLKSIQILFSNLNVYISRRDSQKKKITSLMAAP